jgi:hypothetical protein
MTSLQTGRHRLPMLAVSQAQKEITHNEALVRIDALLHTAIEGVSSSVPPVDDTDIGKCWLVGNAPTAVWTGQADSIAVYIGGGWRHIAPQDGMRIWNRANHRHLFRIESHWTEGPAIVNPANGSVVDVEARTTLSAILQYFRLIGYVAP